MTVSVNLRRHCLAGGSAPVAIQGERCFDRDHLRARTLDMANALAGRPEHSWGIWFADAYEFLCAFMALALAGKRIVMPHNMQPGTASQLAGEFDQLLIDAPLPDLPIPQLTPQALITGPAGELPTREASVELVLFTSGSTGSPQAVPKTLALLETELALLQDSFGERVGQADVVATVSHQHIYGLLHRVLWPWWRGAPFDAALYQYPEELVQTLECRAPAVLVSSPTHLARLPQVPVFCDHPPRIRTTISSGGLLAEADALALAGLLGEAPLEILGSTETGGVAWRCQPESPYWNSLPGVAVARSPGGCLSVTSAHLGCAQPFEMGDRIELLADGRFSLLGRADRVVKVEGKRLSLSEMQRRLEEHPSVSQARLEVVRRRREEVGSVVVLSPQGQAQLHRSGKLSLNQVLRDHLLTCFERPLLPRRWRYVAQLPVDSRGKITAHSLQTLLSGKED